tara:strand:+ start:9326 stop:9628 length:303 start_codon:yes stop_codon:yes gene_type:complete
MFESIDCKSITKCKKKRKNKQFKKLKNAFTKRKSFLYLHPLSENDSTTGEMAEWSNAAVLKTVDCNRSGGSNPSFSAKGTHNICYGFLFFEVYQPLIIGV